MSPDPLVINYAQHKFSQVKIRKLAFWNKTCYTVFTITLVGMKYTLGKATQIPTIPGTGSTDKSSATRVATFHYTAYFYLHPFV